MFETSQLFLRQCPVLWSVAALFFFALGLWWAYLTWGIQHVERLRDARNEFGRLQEQLGTLKSLPASSPPGLTPEVIERYQSELVDAELVAEMHRLGIQSPEQISKLTRSGRAKMESYFATKGFIWDWELGKCVKAAAAPDGADLTGDS